MNTGLEKTSRSEYWKRFAVSFAVVFLGALPFLLGGDAADIIRGQWTLTGFAIEKLHLEESVNLTVWTWTVGFLSVLLLAVFARWKIGSALITGWFLLNIVSGYYVWWALSHS